MLSYIIATRIKGDLYTLLSPSEPTFTAECSWDSVCRLADDSGTTVVVVQNNYRSDGELDRIAYRPAAGVRYADMPRPAMAKFSELSRAE